MFCFALVWLFHARLLLAMCLLQANPCHTLGPPWRGHLSLPGSLPGSYRGVTGIIYEETKMMCLDLCFMSSFCLEKMHRSYVSTPPVWGSCMTNLSSNVLWTYIQKSGECTKDRAEGHLSKELLWVWALSTLEHEVIWIIGPHVFRFKVNL